MTPEQQKQFNAACEIFRETTAKIFATEAPTMERQPGKEPVRDWEILAFRATSKCTLPGEIAKSEGVSNKDLWTEQYLDAMNRGYQEIYIVRRLSDDSTWTLGDEIIDVFDEMVIIRRFESTDKMNVWTDRGRCKLANISKVMDRVYTTADGIHVTKDQKLYSFLSSGDIQTHPTWEDASDKYRSEEAAKAAYISWLYSQPVLTIYDVINEYVHSPDLIQIVQQKLNTK